MGIKYKILIIGILSILSVIGVTIILFYFSYFGYINKEKEQRIARNFETVDYILKNEQDNMQSILVDWGQWDDTYKFINDKNQTFIDSNLQEEAVNNLKLKSMIFLDENKNISYSKEINEDVEFSEALIKKLLLNDKNFNKENEQKIGLISRQHRIYMIGILPITLSDRRGESNGFLVIVREIDKKILTYIERITSIRLNLSDEMEQINQNDDLSYINMENNDIAVYNKKYSEATRFVKDINGSKSIRITITDKGYNSENISHFLMKFIIGFLCLIAIIMFFDVLIVNRYILKRLLKLTEFIEKVATTKDTTLTADISGKDEIFKLANETNKMLLALNSANEEILFLTYNDKLTGLRNRTYMENMFSRLDESREENYFIIMGDINGLKVINEKFERIEGDRALCLMGKILTENCDTDDIISRWGGDEFVILIRNKDESYATNLIDKIKDACERKTLEISIAFGYAGQHEENSSTETIMNLAEKRMYRNKLMESRSPRSSTINSLLRTLHEKHSETEEHTLRIKTLSFKLGKRLKLTKEKIDELELLSLLHDIGKIGIPEHILMKSSKLTDEEWTIMKTHSDIGYRIASSTPELSHIATKILAHHEKYDGTGYPNKLKGEEIPLLSRIICIIDSFDVMTNKRVYKRAFNMEYAIEELKRCSGTQFDPYLVNEFIDLLREELFTL